jgi:hypothetical protein
MTKGDGLLASWEAGAAAILREAVPVGSGPPLGLRSGAIGIASHQERGQAEALAVGERRGTGEDLADAVLDADAGTLTPQVGDEISVGIETAVLGRDPGLEQTRLAPGHSGVFGHVGLLRGARSHSLLRSQT